MSYKKLIQHPVFWLVISLALVTSPHLTRFPAWSILLIVILFIWRLISIFRHGWCLPKWLLIILTLLSCAGIFMHFGTVFGKTAGSVLLSILLAIKLHESQTRRDYMLLLSLSFFIIVTNFLFSQSIPTVLFMLFVVIVLIITMISINQNNAPLPDKVKIKLAVKMLFQAIPLMLVMFILFPRVSGPLWKLPEEKQTATSGLSNTMSPGDISNLIQSNAVAFRAEFHQSIPLQHQLYWRAIILWYFDGRTWEQGKTNLSPSAKIDAYSSLTEYTVTLEPHQNNWLFALDIPVQVPEKIQYTNNFVLRLHNKLTTLYQYNVASALQYTIQRDISVWEKSAGLKIPLNSNPQTVRLGQQLKNQYNNPQDIIDHVLNMYNQQNYHYTLQPPLTPGFNPVDQFLFKTKKGFCEHYASSFTLLMRAAGIPARIVLGYQGGTINPVNQILTVYQKDAHAWSEVWIKNRGWVRIDPTAAIAPQRVELNLNAALDADEARPFHMLMSNSLLKDIIFYWDALDNQWNQWIIGYDESLQQALLEKLLKQRVNLSDIIILMVIGFSLTLIVISLWIFKPWYKQQKDPVVEYYHNFCDKLSRKGIHRELYEGPVDFARRAVEQLPEQKDQIQLITRLYTKLRYETTHTERQIEQFRLHTRRFLSNL